MSENQTTTIEKFNLIGETVTEKAREEKIPVIFVFSRSKGKLDVRVEAPAGVVAATIVHLFTHLPPAEAVGCLIGMSQYAMQKVREED